MLALARRAQRAAAEFDSIGWDIGIAEQGALLVEANVLWSPELMQRACRIPLGRTAFGELLPYFLGRARV